MRDQNFVPPKTVALSTDGATIVTLRANPSTHVLTTSDGTTGTDHGPSNALRDSNFIPVLMAVSSSDGKTPVVLYGTSTGGLLIQST